MSLLTTFQLAALLLLAAALARFLILTYANKPEEGQWVKGFEAAHKLANETITKIEARHLAELERMANALQTGRPTMAPAVATVAATPESRLSTTIRNMVETGAQRLRDEAAQKGMPLSEEEARLMAASMVADSSLFA